MDKTNQELTPVIYNAAAVKILHSQHSDTDEIFLHWHERMELLLIKEGKMRIYFGAECVECPAGTVAIIPPRQLHRGMFLSKLNLCDVVMFDVRSFYNETVACRQYLPLIFEGKSQFVRTSRQPEVVECVRKIACGSDDGTNALDMTSKLYELFYLLYRHCLTEIQQESPFDQTIREVVDYMEEHYAEPLTTGELSARFCYTKPYFCRRFKECTGVTITEYINAFRLKMAMHLIKTGQQSISDVASACGIPDANYFSRCFKKKFGHAPSYYREHQQTD